MISIYDAASARIVGRDLGPLLTGKNRELVERILSEETGAGVGAQVTAMVRNRFPLLQNAPLGIGTARDSTVYGVW